MARKLFRLGLDPASYNPTGLDAYKPEVLMGEYERLYVEAKSRLNELSRSVYGRASEVYKEARKRLKPPSEVSSKRETARLVQEAARFVLSKSSTVAGQREIAEEKLETLARSGYGFVTRPMLKAWGKFIDHLQSIGGRAAYYMMDPEEPVETPPDIQLPSYAEPKRRRPGESREEFETRRQNWRIMDNQRRKFELWAVENGYAEVEAGTSKWGNEILKLTWIL